MAIYEGVRGSLGCVVTVDGEPLPMRLDLCNHSPTGFEWGYGGSGPAQLALAILAHHLQDDNKALSLYQNFKWKVVAGLYRDSWDLLSDDIDFYLTTKLGG